MDVCDARYFDHFRQKCVNNLESLVDTTFWNRSVLQIGASKPAIHHAILALSAQHKAFLTRGDRRGEKYSSDRESCAIYSWTHYSKATKILQRQLSQSPNTAASIEQTLIICLLFIAFEVLQGNHSAALTHLEGGLEIFSNCHPSTIHSQNLSTSSLAGVFKRLDIQASSYLGIRNVKPFSFGNVSQPSMQAHSNRSKPVFTDIRDAFDSLNTHIASVYHFMRSPSPSLRQHPFLHSNPVRNLRYELLLHFTIKKHSIFSGLFEEQGELVDALGSWALAFESFLEERSGDVSRSGSSRVYSQQYAVLWVSYLIIFITLSTCLEPDECSHDRFLAQFQSIVEHAEFVLLPEVQDNSNSSSQPRFSLEMSVIQPLYFTALKCRDHNLRRRAIDLLRISGQEGVWDGNMLAVIAKYIVQQEESQGSLDVLLEQTLVSEILPEVDIQNRVIPESARVHGIALDNVDRVYGKVWIECSKRVFNCENHPPIVSGSQAYEWVQLRKLLDW